jgi:hypothetical protein
VAVEKLPFHPKQPNRRDRKGLGKLRTSFVGLPNAKFFCHFLVSEFFNSHRRYRSEPLNERYGDVSTADLTSEE